MQKQLILLKGSRTQVKMAEVENESVLAGKQQVWLKCHPGECSAHQDHQAHLAGEAARSGLHVQLFVQSNTLSAGLHELKWMSKERACFKQTNKKRKKKQSSGQRAKEINKRVNEDMSR